MCLKDILFKGFDFFKILFQNRLILSRTIKTSLEIGNSLNYLRILKVGSDLLKQTCQILLKIMIVPINSVNTLTEIFRILQLIKAALQGVDKIVCLVRVRAGAESQRS